MHNDFITGLDIGSSSIRVVVGQLVEGEYGKSQLQIIGAVESPSAGINKGVITSIEDAVSSISSSLDQTEHLIGQAITNAWVSIAASNIIFQQGKGVVAVANPDNEIRESDVERAIDSARMVSTPLNHEILHVLPKHFTVDGQGGIKDPVGMTGMRLEVDTQIIQCLSSQSKNLTKCIHRTSLEIDGLVLSTLAASEAVLTDKQKNAGVVLVDIGGASTNILVFEDGEILHSASIAIGANHITSDIAIMLKISIEAAENIKLTHGYAYPKNVDDLQIDLATISDEQGVVSKKYISEIIEARLIEIFRKVDNELAKVNRRALLPAGVVLVGGGARMAGILDLAKEQLRLPAILGYPHNIITNIDKVNDVAFATAVGLVKWGVNWGDLYENESGYLDQTMGKLKDWFKNLLP